jgi:hypothetical protein
MVIGVLALPISFMNAPLVYSLFIVWVVGVSMAMFIIRRRMHPQHRTA